MSVTAAARTEKKPELVELARLALAELHADGLVIVDERTTPARLAAHEGSAADLLAGDLRGLPRPASGDDGCDVVIVDHGDLLVASAPVTFEQDGPVGVMHAAFTGDRPDDQQVRRLLRIFARHAGLLLAYTTLLRAADRDEARAARLTKLDELAFSGDVDALTDRVTELVAPTIGATASCITTWDEDRDILRALPHAFGATDRSLPASITGPASNPQSLASRVFITGRPYMTNVARADPGLHQAYVERFKLDRVLAVPLSYGARRIGVLILANKPTPFTFADVHLAHSVTPRIAMAVELARSFERLRIQQRLESIVADAAVAVATGRPVEDCLRPAFRSLCDATDSSVVGLIPLEGPSMLWHQSEVPEHLEDRLMDDARALAQRSVGAFPQSVGDPGWAALHAPVALYGKRIAALSVLRRTGEPFHSYEAAAVSRLANITALAWATERYQHQLAEIARLRERERIADELHDRVAQILFAAQLGLDSMLEADGDVVLDRQRIREIGGLLTKGDTAIRDVIDHLSADPDATVARRLRLEVEGVEEEFGVAIHVEIDDEQAVNAARRAVADCLVRVAREGSVNAAKHAGPCRITLKAGTDSNGRLRLTVLDDGLGGTPPQRCDESHGLRNLRRAVRDAGGTLRLTQGGSTFGTRLTAVFPLEA